MHQPNQFDLLGERRFAPFFWTQFLGAGNDNIYKNALVIFVAFHAATLTSLDPNALVNLAGAVFIAPFVLLSATAGQLADKFEKSRLIRWIKLFEIAIMVVGLAGFWRRDLTLLFTALALLGVHSTLFGPVKYAILPQHLKPEELIGGNGLVEMGTFVAILLGTIAGGLVVAIEGGGPVARRRGRDRRRGRRLSREPRASRSRRRSTPSSRSTGIRSPRPGRTSRFAQREPRRLAVDARHLVVLVLRRDRSSRSSPASRATSLGGNEHVVTLLLALFSVGIGVGSLLCERLSGRQVELGLVPFGSIGLTLFAVDLWLASRHLHATALAGLDVFLAKPAHWRVAADLVLIGLFGGFYIVPLYALIQERSAPSHRSRIIAANNILNALFMVASAGARDRAARAPALLDSRSSSSSPR